MTSTPLIISAFLSKSELSQIQSSSNRLVAGLEKKNHFLPYRFPDIQWSNIAHYKKLSNDFQRTIALPLEDEIGVRLCKAVSDFSFRSLNAVQQDFFFNPFTVRYQQPEQVDIYHHVENQAVAQFPEFYNKLSNYIEVYDQLSFVIMIQKPQRGGEIILFDEYWEGEARVQEQWDSLLKMDQENTIGKKIKQSIELQEGELLIFPAGVTWHRVGEVYGDVPRITLGGFMGKNKRKEREYLFWS